MSATGGTAVGEVVVSPSATLLRIGIVAEGTSTVVYADDAFVALKS